MNQPSPFFSLAADFIHYSNRSLFLTGKAGTGKTTFLKHIKEQSIKQTAVVAPTGVAAINAGGTTIHSFFQLPFGPFIPENKGFSNRDEKVTDRHSLLGKIKMNSTKRKTLQQLELLIIDEISMVRCDMLDAIDIILRHFRNRYNEPFGGVQLLLIGDLYQLPPVISNEEWELIGTFYTGPYFFYSRVLQANPPVYIELDKVYRQSDEQFIKILNGVRNNRLSDSQYEILHSRYLPAFTPPTTESYITLTTHNFKADSINSSELNRLEGATYSYEATITGEFSEKAYPAEFLLKLKIGAQVMFIKNDTEKIRRFFNGKIGIVEKVVEDVIYVKCKDHDNSIEVKRESWKNIRYTINQSSQQLEEEEIGDFNQYPLRLAWAITIHKSQGLTFEKAIIDAGSAFASGQVYVALSRCTSLEGMVLLSRINANNFQTDERIIEYTDQVIDVETLQDSLQRSKQQYQESVILNLFDFAPIFANCNNWLTVVEDHKSAFNIETYPWVKEIIDLVLQMHDISKRFQVQISQFFNNDTIPQLNEPLQLRLVAAANHFCNQLEWLLQTLPKSTAVTDSKQYALVYNEEISDLYSLVAHKYHLIESLKSGFSLDAYRKAKNNFVMPSFSVNAYAKTATYTTSDSPHPILYKQLRILRDDLSDKYNQPIYMIASSGTLIDLTKHLPQTKEDLLEISGFGKAKVEKYGNAFLEIISKYCIQNKLTSNFPLRKQLKEGVKKVDSGKKPDTKQESYNLYKLGNDIVEIAKERKLTEGTIENHLAFYVKSGDISISELVSEDKIQIISNELKLKEGNSVKEIKDKLGDYITYGDIKFVNAWLEYQQQTSENV